MKVQDIRDEMKLCMGIADSMLSKNLRAPHMFINIGLVGLIQTIDALWIALNQSMDYVAGKDCTRYMFRLVSSYAVIGQCLADNRDQLSQICYSTDNPSLLRLYWDMNFNTMIERNKRYGTDNIADVGVFGVHSRLRDKISRARNVVGGVDDGGESIIETLGDLSNYCIIANLLIDDIWSPLEIDFIDDSVKVVRTKDAVGPGRAL